MTSAAEPNVVALLQRLIRFPTVNPPGDELALARDIAGILAAHDVEHEVVETSPGRAAVIGRVRGDGSAGGALLLLAHMDVVGVERDRWTVDPFAGEVRDGYVYGRGAIDDKGMLAVNLAATLRARRAASEHTPGRDLVFVATPDEETGSVHGLAWLLEHRPELLTADFALNEGGRVRVADGRPLYAAIQTAEKVPHTVRLRATGPSGHASIPLRDNALVRLARAVAAVGVHVEPLTLTETTRAFLSALATVLPDDRLAGAMAALVGDDAASRAAAERVLTEYPAYDAVLRTGVSAVRIGGGVRDNVIPAEGEAMLNVRTLPGASIDDTVARLRAAIGDDVVTVEVASRGLDAPASPVESPLYAALAASLRAEAPGLAVVPYLSTGATDNARLRRAGIAAYGLLPFPLEPGDESRMHGHDERVAVRALHFAVRVVHATVSRVCAPAT